MPAAAVKGAVEARLADWDGIGAFPFYDENDAAPAPATQYVTIEYPVATEDRITIGAKPAVYRERGTIRFILRVLVADGVDAALASADTLRAFFREQQFGGVETFGASPVLMNPQNRKGSFYSLPFVVTYKFDQVIT